MRWDSSRSPHHIKRMESRGLIARERCAEDRRGSLITVTPAGRSTIEQTAPGHVHAVRRLVIDPLTPAELWPLTVSSRSCRTGPGRGCLTRSRLAEDS